MSHVKHLLLPILLISCAGHDPRQADVVVDASVTVDLQPALESWNAIGADARLSADCSGDRACFRVQEGGAPAGWRGGWSDAHADGDCEVYTGGNLDGLDLQVLTHELGHCFGLDHTTARCTDGGPDLMNRETRWNQRICEPTEAAFRALYPAD